MIYKLGLLGATGRMGLEISGLLANYYHQQGCVLELADAVATNTEIQSVEGVPVRTLDSPAREPVHLWVDFSHPSATVELLEQIDTPILIGTTGFEEPQLERIRGYAKEHPVLLASNTSRGMTAMLRAIQSMSLSKDPDFDLALTEAHHRHKKDTPSGTAKAILDVLQRKGARDIQVHSIRAGGLCGIHSVEFISGEEKIEIRHEVWDRKCFATGALKAAVFLLSQKEPGLYTMEQVMEHGT